MAVLRLSYGSGKPGEHKRPAMMVYTDTCDMKGRRLPADDEILALCVADHGSSVALAMRVCVVGRASCGYDELLTKTLLVLCSVFDLCVHGQLYKL